MGRYDNIGSLGVAATGLIFIKDYRWIFREQPLVDMGIDAHIEITDADNNPTGQLIALQIKSGKGNFHESQDSYTLYLSEVHYNYWTNHSLPVVIIAHIPEENITYWQYFDNSTVSRTTTQWKIMIPKANILNTEAAKNQISSIISSKSINGKLTKLVIDSELMKFINKGGKVNLFTQEWHNKSLGRGPFNLILIDKDGQEKIVREWHWTYRDKLIGLIERTFPWADFSIDQDFYAANFDDSYYDVYTDLYKFNNKIYPYKVLFGEVSEYRINLSLNSIGRAFLELEDYLI